MHVGTSVLLHGLVARPELNGVRGTVIKEVDPSSGRVHVRLDEGESTDKSSRTIALKQSNLTIDAKKTTELDDDYNIVQLDILRDHVAGRYPNISLMEVPESVRQPPTGACDPRFRSIWLSRALEEVKAVLEKQQRLQGHTDEPPQDMMCPVSLELMRKPVSLPCGCKQAFEQATLARVAKHVPRCPLCRWEPEWNCQACTLKNKLSITHCEACAEPRPQTVDILATFKKSMYPDKKMEAAIFEWRRSANKMARRLKAQKVAEERAVIEARQQAEDEAQGISAGKPKRKRKPISEDAEETASACGIVKRSTPWILKIDTEKLRSNLIDTKKGASSALLEGDTFK